MERKPELKGNQVIFIESDRMKVYEVTLYREREGAGKRTYRFYLHPCISFSTRWCHSCVPFFFLYNKPSNVLAGMNRDCNDSSGVSLCLFFRGAISFTLHHLMCCQLFSPSSTLSSQYTYITSSHVSKFFNLSSGTCWVLESLMKIFKRLYEWMKNNWRGEKDVKGEDI